MYKSRNIFDEDMTYSKILELNKSGAENLWEKM